MIGFRQFLLLLVIVIVAAHRDLPDNAADLPISQLLSLASTALSAGRSASALEIFDHILIRDPSDFATLYKRATIRLATNQLSKAKDGFKEVLRVKEFDQARLQLAKIYAKLGEFDDAKKEVDELLKHSTLKKEGTELVCSFLCRLKLLFNDNR
jgi:DnaJ family protein C protein 3